MKHLGRVVIAKGYDILYTWLKDGTQPDAERRYDYRSSGDCFPGSAS